MLVDFIFLELKGTFYYDTLIKGLNNYNYNIYRIIIHIQKFVQPNLDFQTQI